MTNKYEKIIVNKVATYLGTNFEDQFSVIDKRIGLWKFPKLKKLLSDNVYLSPDIDILLGNTGTNGNEIIMGVEVKVIYTQGKNLNLKFYHGLDEALALLRFGLDGARLFQVFLIPLTITEQENHHMTDTFAKYSKAMGDTIKTLDLPIGYTAALDFLTTTGTDTQLSADPLQVLDYSDQQQRHRKEQIIVEPKRNPFLNSTLEYPNVIREFLLTKYFK